MVLDYIDLTTKEYVKALDGALTDSNDDFLLGIIIKGVSSKVGNYLRRHILAKERIEFFDYTREMDYHKQMRAYPVTALTEVKTAEAVVLTTADFMTFTPDTGEFVIKDTGLITAQYQSFSIQYTGGMATDTAAFMNIYPDITYELSMQVLFEFKRKKHIALDSGDIGRNGQDTYGKWGLMPDLLRVLKPHKRMALFG